MIEQPDSNDIDKISFKSKTVFAAFFSCLLITYGAALLLNFAMFDSWSLFFDPVDIFHNLYFGSGRFFYGILIKLAAWYVETPNDLHVLRLISIIGFALISLTIYTLLIRLRVKKYPAFLISLFQLFLPPVMESVNYSASYCSSFAGALAILAGMLFCLEYVNKKKYQLPGKRGLLFFPILPTSLLILALMIIQTRSLMVFLTCTITLTVADFRKIGELRKFLFNFLFWIFCTFVAYIVLVKLSLFIKYGHTSIHRGGELPVLMDIIQNSGRLADRYLSTLNLFFLKRNWGVELFVATLILFGVFLRSKQISLKKNVIRCSIYFTELVSYHLFIILIAFLPFIATYTFIFSPPRYLSAVYSIVGFLFIHSLWNVLPAPTTRFSMAFAEDTRKITTTVVVFLGMFFAANGSLQGIIIPQYWEYRYLVKQIREKPRSEYDRIHIIKPEVFEGPAENTFKRAMFGEPSMQRSNTQEPMVKRAFEELEMKIPYITYGRNFFAADKHDFVINMRNLRNFRQGETSPISWGTTLDYTYGFYGNFPQNTDKSPSNFFGTGSESRINISSFKPRKSMLDVEYIPPSLDYKLEFSLNNKKIPGDFKSYIISQDQTGETQLSLPLELKKGLNLFKIIYSELPLGMVTNPPGAKVLFKSIHLK